MCAALLLACAPSIHAQTATNVVVNHDSLLQPTTISETPTATSLTGNGILDQAKLFLSQTDRGLGTWTTTNGAPKTFDLSIGACFENNVNADGIINGDYAIYKRVTIDGFARIWNSSETIKSVGVGPGFELPIGDLKIGAYLDGVYRFDDHCVAVEPALALKNGVGKNAYLGLRLATDFEFSKHGSGQKPYVATFFGINF